MLDIVYNVMLNTPRLKKALASLKKVKDFSENGAITNLKDVHEMLYLINKHPDLSYLVITPRQKLKSILKLSITNQVKALFGFITPNFYYKSVIEQEVLEIANRISYNSLYCLVYRSCDMNQSFQSYQNIVLLATYTNLDISTLKLEKFKDLDDFKEKYKQFAR